MGYNRGDNLELNSSSIFLRIDNAQTFFKTHTSNPTVYKLWYFTNSFELPTSLYPFSSFKITLVQSYYIFNQLLLAQDKPNLILIDTKLNWANSIKVAENLNHLNECPMIFLHPEEHCCRIFSEKAFKAGISDILRLPHDQEELIKFASILTQGF